MIVTQVSFVSNQVATHDLIYKQQTSETRCKERQIPIWDLYKVKGHKSCWTKYSHGRTHSLLWFLVLLQINNYAFGPTMFKSDSKRIQFPLREPRSTELDRQFPGVHVLPSWTCCRTGNLNLVSNSAEFSTPRCPIYIALDRVSQHPTSQPATAVLAVSIAQTLVAR